LQKVRKDRLVQSSLKNLPSRKKRGPKNGKNQRGGCEAMKIRELLSCGFDGGRSVSEKKKRDEAVKIRGSRVSGKERKRRKRENPPPPQKQPGVSLQGNR